MHDGVSVRVGEAAVLELDPRGGSLYVSGDDAIRGFAASFRYFIKEHIELYSTTVESGIRDGEEIESSSGANHRYDLFSLKEGAINQARLF